MKKSIYLILAALMLSACEREFRIDRQIGDSVTYLQFVTSCDQNPSYLVIQATTPLNKPGRIVETAGVELSVSSDGTPVPMDRITAEQDTHKSQRFSTGHKFMPGEEIIVSASVSGHKPVSASFIVPAKCPEFRWDYHFEEGLDDDDNPLDIRYDSILCFDIEYDNLPTSSGRYGIAVALEEQVRYEQCTTTSNPYYAPYYDKLVWTTESEYTDYHDAPPISASSQTMSSTGQSPLVVTPTELSQPSLDRYHSRVQAWIDMPAVAPKTGKQQIRIRFDSQEVHESFDSNAPAQWATEWYGLRETHRYRYKLVFYSFEENCYNYLKSQSNNGGFLPMLGLAPVSCTFTNIRNGIGVCGAYATSETDWIDIKKP